jgi:hypothetical protein
MIMGNYFLVVSFLTESTAAAPVLAAESTVAAESVLAESTLAESTLVESVAEDEPEPLQAAKETAIANANKPVLNEFFML